MTFDLDVMLADLRRLVEVESPSRVFPAITESADNLATLIAERLGTPAELVDSAAGPHVHWRGGDAPKVLIVGHHDTVFPLGTLADRPFTVADGRISGPGVFDMKGGIVLAIHAVAELDEAARAGVELLFTCDEEVGSGASRTLIEERAQACGAVLVLEGAADGGALKIGRKGTGNFVVTVHGKAAHAGLEPENGINALVEAAHQVLAINELGRPDLGTTVTPTVASAGTADNVVPAEARIHVDFRLADLAEGARVEQAFAALRAVDPDTSLDIAGGVNRPPLETGITAELFALAAKVAVDAGIAEPAGVVVGGGSDGNFTGALGIPTLDGLGAIGGGAHADHEHVELGALVERATLVAGLMAALTVPG